MNRLRLISTLIATVALVNGLAIWCGAQSPKVLLLRGPGGGLDFEHDLKCVPNTMTESVGIANAKKINDALAKIGIGGGNGPAAIGDPHGKFWAVAAEIKPTITGATNASPIVITAANHGLVTNDKVGIRNVGGNTAANGVWKVTRLTSSTFSLQGSTGNGAYTGGGEWWNCRIIRIPEVAGGSFFGTGVGARQIVQTNPTTHVVNSSTHEGTVIGSTTLVNTSDPSIIDTTTVLGYFGWGWRIGPLSINGAYARSVPTGFLDPSSENYLKIAAIGLECVRRGAIPTGKAACDITFHNCQAAYESSPSGANGDHMGLAVL